METNALIFLPDISGFTKFVTQTDIQHSHHIVAELLEIVMRANSLGFKVSEVEGDAVLFYRVGEPPSLEELVHQARRMFLDFHAYLRVIERDRVCQCGACQSASQLSLKFIGHYGELQETQIGSFSKLIGSDVILAHVLMKNRIPLQEYLLLTQKYLETQPAGARNLEEWVTFKTNVEELESFGKVPTEFVPLSPLRSQVPDAPTPEEYPLGAGEPDTTITVDAPLLLVHDILTDNARKAQYARGVKEIRQERPINRVHTSHTCVFEEFEVHFVTQHSQAQGKEVRYVERGDATQGVSFVTDYKLTEEDGRTRVAVRTIHVKEEVRSGNALARWIANAKSTILFRLVKRNSRKGLQAFREYVERVHSERPTGREDGAPG
ncbi:MAG: DUF2652 domain-containing protein [Bacteroidota bacterium]